LTCGGSDLPQGHVVEAASCEQFERGADEARSSFR
jgi:hypothetical protein